MTKKEVVFRFTDKEGKVQEFSFTPTKEGWWYLLFAIFAEGYLKSSQKKLREVLEKCNDMDLIENMLGQYRGTIPLKDIDALLKRFPKNSRIQSAVLDYACTNINKNAAKKVYDVATDPDVIAEAKEIMEYN